MTFNCVFLLLMAGFWCCCFCLSLLVFVVVVLFLCVFVCFLFFKICTISFCSSKVVASNRTNNDDTNYAVNNNCHDQ